MKRWLSVFIAAFLLFGGLAAPTLSASAAASTGWKQVSGHWYYYTSKGRATGWLLTGGHWYYFDSKGVMKTGWLYSSKKWYYFDASGIMQTGWLYTDGKWYYFNSNGVMQTGWLTIGGKQYYFYSSGALAVSTAVDGKAIGKDGAVIQYSRATPYSAWINHQMTLQQYSFDTPKVIEIQLTDIKTGDAANSIIAAENMFNQIPANDEQWILMQFNLKYVSGPEEPLNASDVINNQDSFYTTSGQKITPVSDAAFSGQLAGFGEYDVQLYPGGQSTVYYGILVKKAANYPLIRIGTGFDYSSYQTIYSWFSTDPNYHDPFASMH